MTTPNSFEADRLRLGQCDTYEEFEERAGISSASPEAYWAELAWDIAHAVGYQRAWEQASKL